MRSYRLWSYCFRTRLLCTRAWHVWPRNGRTLSLRLILWLILRLFLSSNRYVVVDDRPLWSRHAVLPSIGNRLDLHRLLGHFAHDGLCWLNPRLSRTTSGLCRTSY